MTAKTQKAIKLVAGAALTHSALAKTTLGAYSILTQVGATNTTELPARERVAFKVLPLLAAFVSGKFGHIKTAAGAAINLSSNKLVKIGKDVAVSPFDLELKAGKTSEFVAAEPTTKQVVAGAKKQAKTVAKASGAPKKVVKAIVKVAKLQTKTAVAAKKLDVKSAKAAAKPVKAVKAKVVKTAAIPKQVK